MQFTGCHQPVQRSYWPENEMDRLHYGQNFEKSWSGKIHYHSIEEHPKISKIAKFGREML